MFDVGFSEIVLIAVVALIVIGPEKLPKVARTLGHMFGRLQRYVNEVKADINREIELDELRKLQTQVQDAARDMEQSMSGAARQVESGLRSVEEQLNAGEAANAAAEAKPGAPSVTPSPAPEAGKAEPPQQASLPGFERQ